MDNNCILNVDNLSVEYRTDDSTVYALNGLNLKIQKGEVRGLVGETGAGKTTLALSILGVLPKEIGKITEGSITFEGKELVDAGEKEKMNLRGKAISMIFQDPMSSLNPVATVGDQIKEVIKLHNRNMPNKEIDEKTDAIMRLIGIPPQRKHEYPFQFSGGMKQRIVIAMALVCEPDLLLADEPTTALDVTIQAQILELMRELKDNLNTSMIFITHDLGIVAEFCDTVSIIYGGEIVESGTVEQIYQRKENHPYTKGLFECIPYIESNAKRLVPIEGSMADPNVRHEGCIFCDRCSCAMEKCHNTKPPVYHLGTHEIKCYLYEKRMEE